jgi:hypothetical protein
VKHSPVRQRAVYSPPDDMASGVEEAEDNPPQHASESETPARARELHAADAQEAGLARQPSSGVARRGQPQARAPPVQHRSGAYSVAEFCKAYGLSVPMLYKLWARGEGPTFMKVGVRTLISYEAADKWRRERERVTRQLKQTG